MSVAQMVRSTPSAAKQDFSRNWSSVFNHDQVTNQQSTLFVKKLLAVAISNIAYMRAIFPECAFGDRSLDDVRLKILRDDNKCPGACSVIKWVRGCFDAIDKKYLKQLVMAIYTDVNNEDSVIESYSFHFNYKNTLTMNVYRNKEQIAKAQATSDTKKATISLLRTLIVLLQTLTPLPDNVMFTCKLLYNDDVTPADYEPSGFKPCKSEKFNFSVRPVNIQVGNVNTPFHSINLRIKTNSDQFQEVAEKENIDKDRSIIDVSSLQPTANALEEATTPVMNNRNASQTSTETRDEGSISAVVGKLSDAVAILDVKLENTAIDLPIEVDDVIDLTRSPEQIPNIPERHLDQVDDITKKTKRLSVTANRIFKSSKVDATKDNKKEKCCLPLKFGRKRIRSLKNEYEFELEKSDQQSQEEASNSCGYRSLKRRKSSVLENPLLI